MHKEKSLKKRTAAHFLCGSALLFRRLLHPVLVVLLGGVALPIYFAKNLQQS
jgi:hypothetical protein